MVGGAHFKDQVIADARQGDSRDGDASTKLQRIVHAGAGCAQFVAGPILDDSVLAIAQFENVGVARKVFARSKYVITRAALNGAAASDAVGTRTALEHIHTEEICNDVVAVAAINGVVAQVADQGVITQPASKRIGSIAAINRVVASARQDHIVTQIATNDVGIVTAIQRVSTVPTAQAVAARAAVNQIVPNAADQCVIAQLPVQQIVSAAAIESVGCGITGKHVRQVGPHSHACSNEVAASRNKSVFHGNLCCCTQCQRTHLVGAIPARAVQCAAVIPVQLQQHGSALKRVGCVASGQAGIQARKVKGNTAWCDVQVNQVQVLCQAQRSVQIEDRVIDKPFP